MAQKIKKSIIFLSLLISVLSVSVPAFAGHPVCQSDCTTSANQNCNNGTNPTAAQIQSCVSTDSIVLDLNTIVNVLSAIVGVVVVGVIILGGIQYSMAGDNPGGVGAAKKRIINGLIALIGFLLTYAFLQWIIPGGIFS